MSEMICDYCDEEINDEDRHEDGCQGSVMYGIKVCNNCLDCWQKDVDCKCADCTPNYATYSGATSKGGLPPAVLKAEIETEEFIYQEFQQA